MEGSTIAPFVLKTFEMVSDPATDEIISWSQGNNSFVVNDPFGFSRKILPTYFKHNNFSSFVRQLNTYGFKKVDTDRWEFANEWFLRGQGQLLRNIARRKNAHEITHQQNQSVTEGATEELFVLAGRLKEEEKAMMGVLGQLKEEQRAIEEEVEGMRRRLQVTEKRPLQMMAFLVKLVDNPNLVTTIFDENKNKKKRKRRRLISSEEGEMVATVVDGPGSQRWLGPERLGFQCSLQDPEKGLETFDAGSSVPSGSNRMMFEELGCVVHGTDPRSYSFHGGGF